MKFKQLDIYSVREIEIQMQVRGFIERDLTRFPPYLGVIDDYLGTPTRNEIKYYSDRSNSLWVRSDTYVSYFNTPYATCARLHPTHDVISHAQIDESFRMLFEIDDELRLKRVELDFVRRWTSLKPEITFFQWAVYERKAVWEAPEDSFARYFFRAFDDNNEDLDASSQLHIPNGIFLTRAYYRLADYSTPRPYPVANAEEYIKFWRFKVFVDGDLLPSDYYLPSMSFLCPSPLSTPFDYFIQPTEEGWSIEVPSLELRGFNIYYDPNFYPSPAYRHDAIFYVDESERLRCKSKPLLTGGVWRAAGYNKTVPFPESIPLPRRVDIPIPMILFFCRVPLSKMSVKLNALGGINFFIAPAGYETKHYRFEEFPNRQFTHHKAFYYDIRYPNLPTSWVHLAPYMEIEAGKKVIEQWLTL